MPAQPLTTFHTIYDKAGNMTRGKAPDGSFQRFEYDAAGRLSVIKADNGTVLETYDYGASRERVKKTVANGDKTYYAWGGSSVIAEYTETASQTTMNWAKSYIYAGSRLLSTIKKNGASELTEYHHPDRLGTKLVTDTTANTAKSQSTLPFGALIPAETQATTNQKFTSYDRSGATGLDYAVNRTYNSGQSRFTQVDPIGMGAANLGNPQSLNMFAYTQNKPVDFADPSGLLLAAPGSGRYLCTTTRIWGHYEDGNGNSTGYASKSSTVCQEVGGGAPLNDNEKKKLEKKKKKIDKKLDKDKCRKFLETLGSDAISKLRAQLNDKSNLFSAKRSTDITVEQAGILRGDDGNFLTSKSAENMPAGQGRNATLAVLKWSVSKWFKEAHGGRVRAAVGKGGSIFFKKFGSTTILHENLHRSTGLNDVALANKLGLKNNGTLSSASQSISKALKENGCS